MSTSNNTYTTVLKTGPETLFKDRGSKFIGQVHPVNSEEEIETALNAVRSNHNKATHVCYAWQLGADYEHYRANDDGEPGNSAGMPIYGQLQSFEVTNALVTVVRYYGGTNLGVGGLIQAYKTAAQEALAASKLVKQVITKEIELHFEYPLLHTVMRIIKEEQLDIASQEMNLSCKLNLSIPKKDLERIKRRFDAVYGIVLKS